MEKQQKNVRNTGWKLAYNKGFSNQGSTAFSNGVLTAKPSIFMVPNKGNVGDGSSNFNSKKCFKCQGYGYNTSDCLNRKIIVIIEGETIHKEDLLNEPDQEGEVTYVD